MTFDTDDLARESANAFARQLAAAIHKRFDTRVFGLYLLGSLAHGGFGRRYSDLDMALIVMGELKDNELSDILSALQNGVTALNGLSTQVNTTFPQISEFSTAARGSLGGVTLDASQAIGFMPVTTSSGYVGYVALYPSS